jgi:hypothetical protein
MKNPVNELSNTIDLESTLIRAETLFRKYQRLVEAVDKKENFPAPRKPEAEASNAANGSSNSGTGDSRTATPNKGKGKEDAARVITPELRKLLSKQVDVLPRTTVAENGDGMPTR